MSIHKGDFSEQQAAGIEAEARRLGISFASTVRVLLDRALFVNVPGSVPYQNGSETLTNRYRNEPAGGVRGGSSLSSSGEGGGELFPGREGGGESPPEVVKEKRRKKPEAPPPSPSPAIDSPELRLALVEFGTYRRVEQRDREPMTERAWTLLLNALGPLGPKRALVAVRYAMAKGWRGWEPKFMEGVTWAEAERLVGLTPVNGTPVAAAAPARPRLLFGEIDADLMHEWNHVLKLCETRYKAGTLTRQARDDVVMVLYPDAGQPAATIEQLQQLKKDLEEQQCENERRSLNT